MPERGYELLFVDKVPFPRRPDRAAAAFPARFRRAIAQVRAYIREREGRRRRGLRRVRGGAGVRRGARRTGSGRRARGQRQARAWRTRSARAAPRGSASPSRARRSAGAPGGRHAAAPRDRRPRPRGAARRGGGVLRAGCRAVPTLLVFGGSLGAQRLNEAFGGAWQDVIAAGLAADPRDGGALRAARSRSRRGTRVRRYVDRMDLAFALCDLIVSRAGAATVSEISALGIPAVYVPVRRRQRRAGAQCRIRRAGRRGDPDSGCRVHRRPRPLGDRAAAGRRRRGALR